MSHGQPPPIARSSWAAASTVAARAAAKNISALTAADGLFNWLSSTYGAGVLVGRSLRMRRRLFEEGT